MPLHLVWSQIAVRLALTVVASAFVGFDRGMRGHAAGLRTTILVGVAAAVAMIQANLLLTVGGKTSASFSVLDLMRLPLGILTGVGFIGGGAILKRGDTVRGVTTAATLWSVTVIGLCFGGGQLGLGCAASGISIVTLMALKWLDVRIAREHRARLVVKVDETTPLATVAAGLGALGCRVQFRTRSAGETPSEARLGFELTWRAPETAGAPLDLVARVAERYPIVSFDILAETAG